MPPTIHFVAGLPRSGSTLLQNLLGQNPAHHVTPTSGVFGVVATVQGSWTGNDAFVAQGLKVVEPRIPSMLRGMMYGYYEKELGAQRKVVFDKSRGWPTQIELLEIMFSRRVPIIFPIRDIKAIVASFEKLHRANPVARRQYLGPAYLSAQTIDGRAKVLMSEGGVVGRCVNTMRDALNRGVVDRMIMLPYNRLVTDPQGTLTDLHAALGLPPFSYDPNNVQQITQEDDSVHGWGDLHKVRPRVESPTSAPWEGILPTHTCQWLDAAYADVNQLAAGLQPPEEAPREPEARRPREG